MKFQLLGREIEISEGQKNYMLVLSYFEELADQAISEFNSDHKLIFSSGLSESRYAERFMDTYAKSDYMDSIVRKYVVKTRQYLAKYGVFDLSDETIWNNCIVNDERNVSELQDKFNEDLIYWLDLGSDGAGDDVIIPKIKNKFASGCYQTALRIDIMGLCDYTLNYLSKNGIRDIQFVYKKEAEEAKAIYNNLKDLVVTEKSDKEKLAVSLIQLDFSEEKYYEYIFRNFPESKYEIVSISKCLGIDLSEWIFEDLEKWFGYSILSKITTEEEALKKMSDLQEKMTKYGITECNAKTELERILKDFDKKARTYIGYEYATREESAKAKADDDNIKQMIDELDGENREQCIKLIKEINEGDYVEPIKKTNTDTLKNMILMIEEKELANMCSNIESSNKPECLSLIETITNLDYDSSLKSKKISLIKEYIDKIETRELEEICQGLDTLNESECNAVKQRIVDYDAEQQKKDKYLIKVVDRIYVIWDKEDFERFKELFIQISIADKEQQGKIRQLISETGRTKTKDLFLGALCFLNESDVEAAAKYAVAKEGGMLTSLVNIGKKGTYDALTLNGRIIHPAVATAMEKIKEKKNEGVLAGLGFKKPKFNIPSFSKPTPSNQKLCSACGTEMNPEAKFCPNCGNKME